PHTDASSRRALTYSRAQASSAAVETAITPCRCASPRRCFSQTRATSLPRYPVARSARIFARRCRALHAEPAAALNPASSLLLTRHPIRPEHFTPIGCSQNSGSNGYTSAPGAVTVNITDSFTRRRFSSSRRLVSRAQIGANSGQRLDEQRRTSVGIG